MYPSSWRNVNHAASGVRAAVPDHFRATVSGIPVTVQHWQTTRPHEPGAVEHAGFLRLLDLTFDRFRPDVVHIATEATLGLSVLRHAARRGR